MHVNVPLIRLEVPGETERERERLGELSERLQRGSKSAKPDLQRHCTPHSPLPHHHHHHPKRTSSHGQPSRPQSLKKPLAILDSRKVTVKELRVTSVTVTSPGLTTGLQTSSCCFSDAVTWSLVTAELHSSVLSCPEGDRNIKAELRRISLDSRCTVTVRTSLMLWTDKEQ